jgi:hypothetical protein
MSRSARAFTFPTTKAQIKRLIAAARETRCAKLWWLAVDGTKIEIKLTQDSEPPDERDPWDKALGHEDQ